MNDEIIEILKNPSPYFSIFILIKRFLKVRETERKKYFFRVTYI